VTGMISSPSDKRAMKDALSRELVGRRRREPGGQAAAHSLRGSAAWKGYILMNVYRISRSHA